MPIDTEIPAVAPVYGRSIIPQAAEFVNRQFAQKKFSPFLCKRTEFLYNACGIGLFDSDRNLGYNASINKKSIFAMESPCKAVGVVHNCSVFVLVSFLIVIGNGNRKQNLTLSTLQKFVAVLGMLTATHFGVNTLARLD